MNSTTPSATVANQKFLGRFRLPIFGFIIVAALFPLSSNAQDVYSQLGQALQTELDQIVLDEGMPGITFSLRLDSIHHYSLAAGRSDLAAGAEMIPTDRMLSGSTGKMFFAALALKLIDEGKLNLDDLALEYLQHKEWYSEFPNYDSIRIRHLMNHTSGLPRHLFQPEFIDELAMSPERARSPEYCVQFLRNLPPVHPVGKGWSYSDANYILLGFIVEHITGQDIYELVYEEFITPLGLDLTVPSTSRKIPGLVQGYVGNQNPFRLPESVLTPEGLLVIDPGLEWTGGGFATNPADLTTFVSYIQESSYLSDEIRELMRSAVNTANGRPYDQGYGLGCFAWSRRNDTRIGHPGFFPGYVTHVEYSLARQYSIAIQINSDAWSSYLQQFIFRLENVIDIYLDEIDETKIRDNFNHQKDCWNRGDVECYMQAYSSEDTVLTVSSGGITIGYDAILENYRTYFPKNKMGKLHFDQMQFQRLTDQFYFTSGRFNLDLPGRDETASGYFSVVLKKVNGWWWIVTDHSS